jgi:hypothetical protein
VSAWQQPPIREEVPWWLPTREHVWERLNVCAAVAVGIYVLGRHDPGWYEWWTTLVPVSRSASDRWSDTGRAWSCTHADDGGEDAVRDDTGLSGVTLWHCTGEES